MNNCQVISTLKQLEGLTVKSVSILAANLAHITTECGKVFEVEAEPIGYGIYAPTMRTVSEIKEG